MKTPSAESPYWVQTLAHSYPRSRLVTERGRVRASSVSRFASRSGLEAVVEVPPSANTWARSRRSSAMRARIAVKSSAARGWVTFPPFLLVADTAKSTTPDVTASTAGLSLSGRLPRLPNRYQRPPLRVALRQRIRGAHIVATMLLLYAGRRSARRG